VIGAFDQWEPESASAGRRLFFFLLPVCVPGPSAKDYDWEINNEGRMAWGAAGFSLPFFFSPSHAPPPPTPPRKATAAENQGIRSQKDNKN